MRSLSLTRPWPALLLVACTGGTLFDAGSPDAGGDDAGVRAPLVCDALPAGVAAGHTGAVDDVVTSPSRRLVLMGGGPEVDAAMRPFIEAADGGDLLVLRASGSTETYLPYLANELSPSPPPSSVAVLRIDDATVSGAPAVTCRVDAAEGVWLAGGDQSAYLLEWRAPLHESLASTAARAASIGGTSAGAMSLGEVAFDAALGSVTSSEALLAPTDALVSVSRSTFAQPELAGFVVDTHFTERTREGRLLAFLAHARLRHGVDEAFGLGLDEEVALVIADGVAEVHAPFGGAAWLYRFPGEATLADGAALDMDVVQRARLDHGDTLVWPPRFAAFAATELTVTDGVIEAR